MSIDYNDKINKLITKYDIVKTWIYDASCIHDVFLNFIELGAIDNVIYVQMLDLIDEMDILQIQIIENNHIPDFFKYYMERYMDLLKSYLKKMDYNPYHEDSELNTSEEEMTEFCNIMQSLPY